MDRSNRGTKISKCRRQRQKLCPGKVKATRTKIPGYCPSRGIYINTRIFLRMWREECGTEKAKLVYDHPEDFVRCFWQTEREVKMIWIVYRVIVVLYFSAIGLVIVILRHLQDSPWYKNLIFFYSWTYFVELLAFVLALAVVVTRYRQEKKNPQLPPMLKMPWYYKLLWILYMTSASCGAVITLIFVIFIYSVDTYSYLTYSIITHTCNTLTLFVDFCIAAIPFRLSHVYVPLIFSVSYGFFSAAYQFIETGNHGHIPIYNALDWRDPVTALKTCAVHILSVVLAHCAYTMMHLLKHYLKNKAETSHPHV